MRNALLIFSIIMFFSQCTVRKTTDKDFKIEILSALFEDEYEAVYFTMYSDSTYIFKGVDRDEEDSADIFSGKYFIHYDTIEFLSALPFHFKKAIRKTNFLEFLNGDFPFKIPIKTINSSLAKSPWTDKFRDYSFFTYNKEFFDSSYFVFDEETGKYYTGNYRPYDLKITDVRHVEKILTQAFEKSDYKNSDYLKQCVAVTNENNEIEVWVYLSCKEEELFVHKFPVSIIEVNDGWTCFYKVHINLSQNKIVKSISNGSA